MRVIRRGFDRVGGESFRMGWVKGQMLKVEGKDRMSKV